MKHPVPPHLLPLFHPYFVIPKDYQGAESDAINKRAFSMLAWALSHSCLEERANFALSRGFTLVGGDVTASANPDWLGED